MKDYSTYYEDSNHRMLDDAILLFDLQLGSNEGFDVVIDKVACRILIYNHLNDLNESKEERIITCKKDIKIGRGSIVEFQNEDYIVNTEMDDHITHLKGKMTRVNSALKFKYNNTIYSIPAIITNQTGYAIGIKEGKFFDIGDTKLSATIGINKNNKEDVSLNVDGGYLS